MRNRFNFRSPSLPRCRRRCARRKKRSIARAACTPPVLFDETGRLLVVHEDVGRHNAVDKVLGHAFLNDLLPLNRHVLVVSGRLSFEIMQKALAGRIPIVAAVSAPSSLAVDFARENGQTLIGFLREKRMNVYCGHERIAYPEVAVCERIGNA